MCGIAGSLRCLGATGAEELDAIAADMAASLDHRGPDDRGVWSDASAGVALAQTRLAVIDLSPGGHQPMTSACGRYRLVFNGEIYNHQELRRDLERGGFRFRHRSDTEVLLETIAARGLRRALEAANGMFALAVWDARERRLSLARDRLGEKPLYYGWSGRHFLFASELKALRRHPAARLELDSEALTLFLRYNVVPGPRSIYRGIAKLGPGQILEVGAGDAGTHPSPVPYWSLREVAEAGLADQLRAPAPVVCEELDALLRDSVRLRMAADVPLGAFLSGGIDSSLVVALAQAASDRPVRTFTIGFRETTFDEAPYARAVAAHLGTDHTELYVTPAEAMAVIPSLPQLYDEPFADSSQIATALVSDLARRHVTVSLSGDGGDELFAGYSRHLYQYRLSQTIGRLPRRLRALCADGLQALPERSWDRLLAGIDPLLPRSARQRHPGDKLHKLAGVLTSDSAQDTYLRLLSLWPDPASLVLGGREPLTLAADPALQPDLDDDTARILYLDAATYLPDDILVKLDRASMSRSLEARVPLLDHRLVEFSWRVPLSLKIRGGAGKWVLRRLLAEYVPPALTERPKTGFEVPLGDWLRGPLRPWAEELLDERRLRQEGVLSPEPIRRRWREHLRGERDGRFALWGVLMFQAWWESVRSEARASVTT
jgi:asparagine synthase (glutamine-hydrolysing)